MTTIDLIAAVRALVAQHRAQDGYVCENIAIERGGDRRYWHAHVWFRRCDSPVDGHDVIAVMADLPEEALQKLQRGIALRKQDPIHSRDVLPDEIDMDPPADVEVAS